MALRCGIVGLPNVGKSTLFNALTSAAVAAENYPFCTIEPNSGMVVVPDARLDALARLSRSERVIPAQVELVDIAGLVAGAAEGHGLGNRFLAHIRETQAIAHVVRCFEAPGVVHVEGRVDALADVETIETELMLADLETVEAALNRLGRKAGSGDREAARTVILLQQAAALLGAGTPLRSDRALSEGLVSYHLLSAKPVLYVANVGDEGEANAQLETLKDRAGRYGDQVVWLHAALEGELLALEPADRQEYMATLGWRESGMERLVRAIQRLLGLITFFTTGPQETRAWQIVAGTKAAAAAGIIHSDFEKHFIRAEVVSFPELMDHGSFERAFASGTGRLEGRDYVVQDGDVVYFRVSA